MDILSIGSLAKDITYTVSHFPQINEQIDADWFQESEGGSAGNVAVYGAKTFGCECGVGSIVGDDTSGKWLIRGLSQYKNINCDGILLVKGGVTQTNTLITDKSNNRIVFVYRGSTEIISDGKFLDILNLTNTKYMHISSWLPELSFASIEYAHGSNTRISYNPGSVLTSKKYIDRFIELIPKIDIIFLNKHESQNYSNKEYLCDVLDFYRNKGGKNIIITDAEKGSYISYNGNYFYQPSYVVDVVDPTGAGDAYATGFLASIIQGNSLISAAKYASMIGAFVVTKPGVREMVPTKEELIEFSQGKEIGNNDNSIINWVE